MYEFNAPQPVTVDLRIGGGSCEIRTEPRETAVVEVEPYDDSENAQQAARDTRVALSDDDLLIIGPERGGWLFRRSPRLRVTVVVPTGSSGRLNVASADLSCHGDWAGMKINTASGDVYVDHVTGDLAVNTASGDVRTNRVEGALHVNTASGDVSATRVDGGAEIKGASANVEIEELGTGLRSSTASGDVRVGGVDRGNVTVNSASGDVSIGVLAGTGVWLDLNTLSGRTRSDLNVGDDAPRSHDLSIQVRTISGDITLHRVNQSSPA